MNITQCPQCGGKVRSESIGWTCESCHGFIDMQGGFHPHREEPFMSPMTNDDRIRAVDRLQTENEKVRAELDSVKCERDAAIKDLFEIIGDIEEIRCGYGVNNADADKAFAELCGGYCANVGNFCYEEGEHYRCKHFKWRGPQKED